LTGQNDYFIASGLERLAKRPPDKSASATDNDQQIRFLLENYRPNLDNASPGRTVGIQAMMQLLTLILEIQEKDLNMLRLMDLKRKRKKELDHIIALRKDLQEQLFRKENDVLELKKDIKLTEAEIREAAEKVKKLDSQQGQVKKVEEFNALSKEMSEAERKRVALEKKVEEMSEQLSGEQEVVENLKESLTSTTESSKALEEEIVQAIHNINQEGRTIQSERDEMAKGADPEILAIYERLLANKRDRVVVPIEHRTCSGCHIVVTAQHENLVRKGERLVFCEHCSRIHYWQEAEQAEDAVTPKRRRRRASRATA
jgi:predicted  nucleic acid-binding Zn-ribbon protein